MALGALTLPSVSTGFSKDSKAMVPVTIEGMADKIQKMLPFETMQEVFFDIRYGITNIGEGIFGLIESIKNQTGLLNSTLLGVIHTLKTIGGIAEKDLDIEQESFKEDKENEAQRERDEALGKEKGEDEGEKGGGFLASMKEGFGGLMDFLTPKSDLLKVGLAGLLVAGVITFRKQIEKVFEGIFTYIGELKDLFDEEGVIGVKTKIGEDIKKNIINPSLGILGLELKEDGSIGRIPGSFFDLIDPISGPTNIFKTIRSLRTGINEYDNNSRMYPDWYYKGFMENLNDLLTPEDPDMLVNAIKNTMNGITKGISDFFNDTEIVGPGGETETQRSGMGKIKDQMMENFRNNMQSIADFFHDKEGNLFGINFSALADLLPTIQDIAKALYFALPPWARFDTMEEKETAAAFKSLKKESDFYNPEVFGKSIINRKLIDEVSANQLKALLAKDSDDLKPDDIRFIENAIREKEKLIITNNNKESRIDKTSELKREINNKKEIISDSPVISVVKAGDVVANSGNSYSQVDQNYSAIRVGPIEMTAADIQKYTN
jgi:hypothetical protein